MTRDGRFSGAQLWGGLLVVLGAMLLTRTMGLVPSSAGRWADAAVIGVAGLGCLAIYAWAPARWGLLLPAGTLLSLAVVYAVEPAVGDTASGAIFLLGLAATFGVVAVAPGARSPRTWAWIPAAVLTVLAAIALGPAVAATLWPLALVIAGASLVAYAWRGRGRRR